MIGKRRKKKKKKKEMKKLHEGLREIKKRGRKNGIEQYRDRKGVRWSDRNREIGS